jgi:dienelactone hydrolase
MVKHKTRPRLGIGLACLTVMLPACATDPATLQKRLEPHYRAQRPEGPGPFPAVLLVPGCGGISPGRVESAKQLVGRGYAVVFVDYISSRGLQAACGGQVRPDEVADDIRAVSGQVRTLSYIRQNGLGVVGWSLGGAGVLASLGGWRDQEQPWFNAAAAFYPPCAALRPWRSTISTLVLLAGLDDIAPPGPCQDLVRSIRSGPPIEVRMYSDARHSFDSSDLAPLVPSRAFPGRTAGYHAEAARQAWSEILALFDRELRQSK